MNIASPDFTSILADIRAQMQAKRDAYHLPEGALPEILAVTKTHSAEQIEPLLQAGHRLFGENRVQEAAEKWPALRASYPDLRLHLIGPLQSNKTKEALQLFDVIETLDRPSLAESIVKEQKKEKEIRTKGFLVQINTGNEPQKAGVAPEEADAFLARAQEEWKLPIFGLMCIPPAGEKPIPHFVLLQTIAKRNHHRFTENPFGLPHPILSMGMSGDYPEAAACGAAYVRLGSRLFGERLR